MGAENPPRPQPPPFLQHCHQTPQIQVTYWTYVYTFYSDSSDSDSSKNGSSDSYSSDSHSSDSDTIDKNTTLTLSQP